MRGVIHVTAATCICNCLGGAKRRQAAVPVFATKCKHCYICSLLLKRILSIDTRPHMVVQVWLPHLLLEVIARAGDVADDDVGQQVARLVSLGPRIAAGTLLPAAESPPLAGLLHLAACRTTTGLPQRRFSPKQFYVPAPCHNLCTCDEKHLQLRQEALVHTGRGPAPGRSKHSDTPWCPHQAAPDGLCHPSAVRIKVHCSIAWKSTGRPDTSRQCIAACQMT